MRTLTADQEQLYDSGHYQVRARVKVEDGDGSMQDLTTFKGRNWIVSIDYGGDIDAQVMDANVSLHRAFYNDVMAPLHRTSRLNLNAGGSYDPLVDLGRAIRIEVAIVAEGHEPASGEWENVFEGYISEVDWSGDTVDVVARDKGMKLQDTWIESNDIYGSAIATDLEDILQDIIDDHAAPVVTLYTPTSPGWMIASAFQVEIQSVMDELQLLADQLGWWVRYKWDSGTSAWRLTLFTPDRSNTTPDREFAASAYFDITEASKAIDDIRNAVTVTYPSGSDASGTIFASVTQEDATSISTYGRRWMGLTEASTSLIDTQAEAEDLGDYALSDLADPKVAQTVSMPYFHAVELGDLYRFSGNGETHTADLDLAVVMYRHTIDESGWTTELMCSGGKPKGGTKRWIEKSAAAGISSLSRDTGPTLGTLSATDAGGSTTITVDLPHDLSFEEIEWHVGTSSGFTPDTTSSSTSFLGRSKTNALVITPDESRFPIDTTFYVKACAIDNKRNRGAFTAAVAAKCKTLGTAFLSSETRIGTLLGGTFAKQSKGTASPPDGWVMVTGSWSTDADVTS